MEHSCISNDEKYLALRAAVLNWYPFPEGERALLIGSNTNALIPLLRAHYPLLDFEIHADAVYDCIVAADLAEESEDWAATLRRLYESLDDNGILLLEFRNRFGIRYLCGGTDEYVKTPFGTMDPPGPGPRLYARREMEQKLCEAGFAMPQMYFLMPDADFVQAVYTEEHLPDDSIRDRVFPSDLYDSPLVAWESDLYDDLVREKTLPAVCNAYLAECRKPGAATPDKHVIYAALSTDRGEAHGFATLLYSDGSACKKALFSAGRKTLETLYANMTALQERGILTVPQSLSPTGIEMPLIREEGLMHYLRRQLRSDPDAFLSVFDQIYHDVLQSSPLVDQLPEKLSETWGTAGDPGPVLKKAWIDMIPYNAFWANGKIRYYDQEFTVESCPAKYVLFRALYFTRIHIPETTRVFPLEQLQERFGLQGLWDGFVRYEERFVAENRNRADLEELYAHAVPDRQAIAYRKTKQEPSVLLREVHAVQLELLKELKRVCETHHLQYMAIHGTLLGAVRHHGFIPWDHDVDIAMSREDYDQLLQLEKEQFSPGFFLQTPLNDYGCFYGGYSKLRRDGKTAIDPQNRKKPSNTYHAGVWIDIFPLDACPEKKTEREKLQKRLRFLQQIVYAKTYTPEQFVPEGVPGHAVSLYYLLAKCTRRRLLVRRIDEICRSRKETSLQGILACYYGSRDNKNVWPSGAVQDTIKMPFEDIDIPVPVGWDEILRTRYGDNYMRLPSREKRYRNLDITYYL